MQRAAMRVWDEEVALRDAVGAEAAIADRLAPGVLDRCFDLEHQLRHIPAIFKRTLALKDW